MEVLRRPFFIISVMLFAVHQVLQWGLKIHLPIVDAYLDNLLLMPIVLTLWLAENRILFKRKTSALSVLEILLATFYFLLITEWIFPILTTRFTTDLWDVPVTAAGSLLYYFFAPTAKKHKTQNQ